MKWKERFGYGLMVLGVCVITATPIVHIVLAVNGIAIPSVLMWCLCMIGVACLGLGVVFSIHDTGC